MKKYLLFALTLVALLFVSCSPSPKAEEEPVNPIVGYWSGRGEYMLFRDDGTFTYTIVYINDSRNYNGTWVMSNDGKLTAFYRKASSDCYVAWDSNLIWEGDNYFRYPDPYSGYHYLNRIM